MKHRSLLLIALPFLLLFITLPSSLTAQESEYVPGSGAKRIKESMLRLADDMVEVTDAVTTMKGAEAAEPKIEAMMNRFLETMQYVLSNLDQISDDDFLAMQQAFQSPEVTSGMVRADASMSKLKEEHPEVAAKIEELGAKHSAPMEEAMEVLMQKFVDVNLKSMNSEGGGAGADPGK